MSQRHNSSLKPIDEESVYERRNSLISGSVRYEEPSENKSGKTNLIGFSLLFVFILFTIGAIGVLFMNQMHHQTVIEELYDVYKTTNTKSVHSINNIDDIKKFLINT